MSGSFPTTIKANSIDVTSISPNFISTTHSLKRQVRSRGNVHRWLLTLGFPTDKRSVFAPIAAFLTKQAGQFETFTYQIPNLIGAPLGDYSGTVTVNGNHLAGDDTIAVLGSSGTLGADSWIVFANHTKVYKVVEDSTSVLTIFPPLQEDVSDTTAVSYDSPIFTVSKASDSFVYSAKPGSIFSFDLNLIEDY